MIMPSLPAIELNDSPVVRFGDGAIGHVDEILRQVQPSSIFLVTGDASYASSGAETALTPVLARWNVRRFRAGSHSADWSNVERGLTLYRQRHDPILLAVGGGVVLDTAKLISVLSANDIAPLDLIQQRSPLTRSGPPVLAVPTTAGTGSEATHFAVVYVDKTKFSVAHESMLPRWAVIDPQLTHSAPPDLTAATGLDALSQAIESLWSASSTPESADDARAAVQLARDNLWRAVRSPSRDVRFAMSKASYLAGRAINVTRTTAPHALSYAMTAHFGVPHGHAVALTVGEMLVYNGDVSHGDVNDRRGPAHVRGAVTEICHLLGCEDARAARVKLSELIASLGLSTRLRDVGIRTAEQRQFIVDQANLQRLTNNPRQLTSPQLVDLLGSIA